MARIEAHLSGFGGVHGCAAVHFCCLSLGKLWQRRGTVEAEDSHIHSLPTAQGSDPCTHPKCSERAGPRLPDLGSQHHFGAGWA